MFERCFQMATRARSVRTAGYQAPFAFRWRGQTTTARNGGGGDGGDGNVAGGEEGCEPDGEGDADAGGREADQEAGAGRDAFAALEAEEAGPVVAGHGQGAATDGECHSLVRRVGQRCDGPRDQSHAAEALQHVQGEGEDAQGFADRAEDIGGADVTAAEGPDVLALRLGNQKPKGTEPSK
jgi:hypothetical protein